ncbi:MAG: S-methyl-5-thioribose-1-phosphate isomerase [Phycisphaerae bacterium]
MISSAATSPIETLLQKIPRSLEWIGDQDGYLRLLDQTLLPQKTVYLDCRSAEQVHHAIRKLGVRGAPAIGCAAAYGLCLGAREARDVHTDAPDAFQKKVADLADYLCGARPTAVNLEWAVRRVQEVATANCERVADCWDAMLAEAHKIYHEDVEMCRQIGTHGADLIHDGYGVLTHCNAGALATSAYGTALSVMYAAHAQGRKFRVFADETRPLLQGSRLTAYELSAAGVDVTVLCDSAAGSLMARGMVDLVIVGADRIVANGDVANKIGTYTLAVLAKHHKIPFYVAAPGSTFDLHTPSGKLIPIEARDALEVRKGFGTVTVAEGAAVLNPAFDVTPAELVTGIITEKGRLEPVSERKIFEFFHETPCKRVQGT